MQATLNQLNAKLNEDVNRSNHNFANTYEELLASYAQLERLALNHAFKLSYILINLTSTHENIKGLLLSHLLIEQGLKNLEVRIAAQGKTLGALSTAGARSAEELKEET